MRANFRFLSFVVAITFLSSCSTLPTVSEPTADTIRLGVYLPMTGKIASYGKMEWEGIRIANTMKPAVLGKKIELILVDTESDKSQCEKAVRRLVEKEKVTGILGEAVSGHTMAGNPVSEAARIPSVTPTSTNPLVTQGKEFAFRTCVVDPFQGIVAARFAIRTLKARRAVVLVDVDQDYSVGLANFFVREFVNLSGEVLSTLSLRTGEKDFSSQLGSIRTLSPDIIYAPNYYNEVALVAKQARSLGVDTPILAGDGAQADALIEVGGASVENMYFTAHFNKHAATSDYAKEFIKRYEDELKKDTDAFAALGADAYLFLVEGIERAASTDGAKIRDALASSRDFKGVSGVIHRMENGNPLKSMNISTVKNGRFVYLTTVLATVQE